MEYSKIKCLSWVEIHLATLLFGVAGLFAKFLSLSALYLVAGRAFFASLALCLFLRVTGVSLRLCGQRDSLIVAFLGAILAFHWFSFFYAIQLSSVAIGLLSFASFPIFVTLLEPYFFKEKMRGSSLITMLITSIGIFLIVPAFDMQEKMTQGVMWGVLSGFSFAALALLNRKYTKKYNATKVSFYQNTFAFVFMMPLLSADIITNMSINEWIVLALLGVIFTAIAHTLYIDSLKTVKAQQASVIISLEPVYGIVFAAILLSEIPSSNTFFGGLLILAAATYATTRK